MSERSPEEIRVRSVYLFLACSQAVEQFTQRLATIASPALRSNQSMLEQSLKRELGTLFRYWTTRQIWQRWEVQEADAKSLNLALLRLFTSAFRLPQDGSGLRYAELSSPDEETLELSRRLTNALGVEYPPLLTELRVAILPWRDAVVKYTAEALELPVEELTDRLKDWADRMPGTTS